MPKSKQLSVSFNEEDRKKLEAVKEILAKNTLGQTVRGAIDFIYRLKK